MKLHQFSAYQKIVVAILALLQFTVILDFMIISPMGAILMPVFNISPAQFGVVVSAYAFSAGISGILASGFADRFDRKKMLLFFYSGFVLGTLACGLASSYEFLLLARIITGVFGGVIGSIVLAITTDLFSFDQRGRVMGIVQTAFGASQILGIPAGLYFSNLWGWHAPFLMIVLLGLLITGIIFVFLKPISAHLKLHPDKNAFHHFQTTVTNSKYLLAFSATALLSVGGFMMMPFGSDYTVHNLGIELEKLPLMYLFTGICAIITGPLVGRASDRFGKYNVFIFGAVLTIIMVMIYTHLGVSTLPVVIAVNSIMFVGIFSRIIPSQALMSAIPEPTSRGSFMAISSSLQQISGGVASVIAGMIVVKESGGNLKNFDIVGYIVSASSIVTVFLMYFIHKLVKQDK